MPKTNLANPWKTKDERFSRNIKAGLSRQGRTYKDLAVRADISAQTVYVRYREPGTMTVRELRTFIETAKLSEEEVLDLLYRNK